MTAPATNGDNRALRALSFLAAMILGAVAIQFLPVPTPSAPKLAAVRPRVCLTKRVPRPALSLGFATPPEHAALANDLRWKPGTTLRVAYRGGSQEDRDEFTRALNEWSTIANLKFVVTDQDPAEIRVQIDDSGGSWSFLGKEALDPSIGPNDQTVNLGWRNDYPRSLHEAGHILGYIHEHQIPGNPFQWNMAALRQSFGTPPNSWSDQEIMDQIVTPSNMRLANGSKFDPLSVMCYEFGPQDLNNPSAATIRNEKLSANDIALTKQWYPK